MRVLLATGRELDDLFVTFRQDAIFDRIVVESGTLLLNPTIDERRSIAPPPPPGISKTAGLAA